MDRELTSPRRLHWLMQLVDLTPAKLGEKSGLSASSINRFFKGTRTLSDAARSRLLAALEAEVADRKGKIEALKTVGSGENAGYWLPGTVLTAALSYSARYQEDDCINENITHELSQFFSGVYTPVEIARGLGTYIGRLEGNLAAAYQRIRVLESQLFPPQDDDAIPKVVEVA